MLTIRKSAKLLALTVLPLLVGHSSSASGPIRRLALNSSEGLELVDAKAEVITYKGRHALHLVALPDHAPAGSMMAIVSGTDFKDGTIEVEVAGSPGRDAAADDRGFIGLAFRAQEHAARREVIYIRPTNGRADDQLRRSHSVQYESLPDFPWYRLRQENPGAYESYADLEAGAWTHMKIVVSGTEARLYVNGVEPPTLIVKDLKLGESHGEIALWAYWSTDAYFSSLIIRPS